jgi:hypothetical protein
MRRRTLQKRYGRANAYPPAALPSDATKSTSEYALLKQWKKARRRGSKTPVSKVDAMQYQLQSMSGLGWRMVWGTEWAKERGD